MKIDFTKKLVTLAGGDIGYGTKTETTLMDVALDSLLTSTEEEKNLSGEEKARRYVLSTRIYSNPTEIDLTAEEIALIKKLIGKLFGALVVGQSFQYLEGK